MLTVEESIPSSPRLITLNVPQLGDVTSVDSDYWSYTYQLGRRMRRVRPSFGEAEGTFLSQEVAYGYPPINVGADYPYGELLNRFYNTLHLFSDWKFEAPSPNFKGKKPLRHHSVRGEVAVRYKTVKVFTRCATWPNENTVSSLVPVQGFSADYVSSVDTSLDLQLTDIVSQFTGDLSSVYTMPWPENNGYYEGSLIDYAYRVASNLIDVRVLVYYVSHWQGQINATWAVVHRYCWYLNWGLEQPYEIHVPLGDVVKLHYLEENVVSGLHFWAEQHPLSWYRSVLDQHLDGAVAGHCEGFTQAMAFSSDLGLAVSGPRVMRSLGLHQPYSHVAAPDISFLRFTKMSDALLRDALPHAAIAAQDALESGAASLGLNMYESLPEFLGVFALVDVVKLAKDAVKLVRSRNVSVSTLSAMIDLLCDARLLYAYALRPSAQDLVSIANGAKSLRQRYFSGGDYTKTPLDGSASVLVPYELSEPFTGVWLRSTVKIEGRYDPDSLLLRLLPLKAVGMLPELSLLWASLPFSFIIDNVINVSNALEAVDMFLQTYFFYRTNVVTATHLFKWTVPIEQLNAIDATQDDVIKYDLEYRSFYREIYPNIPVVGPSRILQQYYSTHVPADWATYGALTYKLLS